MSNIIDETEKRLGSMVPQAVYDLAREAATLRAENERMREEAVFALDRISDWESDYLTDDQPDGAVRDWLGHVSPSLERLRALTEPTKEIGNDPL